MFVQEIRFPSYFKINFVSSFFNFHQGTQTKELKMADGHVGMLLINLQELRHPTKLESRLLQIQDEYSMLRDSGLLKASEGKFDMSVFVNELKIELERNKIPIFDSYQRGRIMMLFLETYH